MLFDGALLALGNVRPHCRCCSLPWSVPADPDLALAATAALSPLNCLPASSPAHQILFLAGITALTGPRKTLLFFARKDKLRGTAAFFTGILLVFLFKVGTRSRGTRGWPTTASAEQQR
jgi:hypothetical protein